MMDLITKKQGEFQKVIEHFKNELATLRTGRANAGLVEHIEVEAYGAQTPIMHVAQITVPEPRMIAIQPYDKSMLKDIEKAIQQSNLGINPVNDGNYVRLTIPQMTEERRKEVVKMVSQLSEKARVGIRNIREEIWKEIQKLPKEDDKRNGKEELQEMIDKQNDEIKQIAEAKEKEIMTI